MTEWWSYGLSDFLMFSPQAWWRLVARYNAAWWPAQLAGVAACAALLVIVRRGGPARTALVIVAAAWAFTGWAFHGQRHAEIFLGASGLALAHGFQALLLIAAAMGRRHAGAGPRVPAAAAALVALALLFPLLSFAQGRGWQEAEVFGFMPDPTALATLGVLFALGLPTGLRVALAVVPVLSLLLGIATRWLIA